MARSKVAAKAITPEAKDALLNGATVPGREAAGAVTVGGLDYAGAAAKAVADADRARLQFGFLRGNGNPNSFLQQVRAKQSASSAYGDFVGWQLEDAGLYDLHDEMADKDHAIGGAEETFAAQVVARPIRFEVEANGDEDHETMVRLFLERHLLGLKGSNGLLAALRTSLIFARRHGHSEHEIIWGEATDPDIGVAFVPRALIHRHPGQFRFDSTGKLFFQPYDATWTSSGAVQAAPPWKFITHVNGGHYGSPYGDSEIFPLRFIFWFKRDAQISWINNTSVNGQPIMVVKTNGGAQDDRKRTSLEDALKALTSNSALILGDGEELQAIARGVMNGVTPHERLLDKLDEMIVRRLTGSTLSTMENNGSGSLSQALTHLKVADEKRSPTALALADTWTRDLVEPVVAMNFGPDVKARLVIDTEDPREADAVIKIYDSARRMGVPVSKRQYRKDTGLEAPAANDPDDELKPPALPDQKDELPEDDDPKADVRDPKKTRAPKMSERGHSCRHTARMRSRDNVAKFDDRKKERSRGRELKFSKMLEQIAEDLAGASRDELLGKMKDALAKLRREYAKDSKLTVAAADAFGLGDLFAGLREGVISSRALGMLNILEAVESKTGGFKEIDPKDLGDDYRDGVEWMLKRDIMERDAVRKLAGAIAEATKGMTAEQIERELRSEILALAASPNAEVTKRIQSLIASAVENGTTVGEFLEAMDGLVDAGTLPAGLDSYLHTVYNTEVANAYGRQRQAIIDDPDMEGLIWGKEFLNPDDADSRETHGAMDGVKVKLGSAADLASKPGPPWSYNCRCTWITILDETEETPGALSKVLSIERFT